MLLRRRPWVRSLCSGPSHAGGGASFLSALSPLASCESDAQKRLTRERPRGASAAASSDVRCPVKPRSETGTDSLRSAGAAAVLAAALNSPSTVWGDSATAAAAEEAAAAALASLLAAAPEAFAEVEAAGGLPALVRLIEGAASRPVSCTFAAAALGFVVRDLTRAQWLARLL